MANLLFQLTHGSGNQYVFSLFLYDANGTAITGALIEYYKRRAAPGQVLPAWETTPSGSAYTGSDGTIRFEIAYDATLTGYKDQWKMYAPVENVWSNDTWELTIGGDVYKVVFESPAPPDLRYLIIPILLGAAGIALIWYFFFRKPKPQPVEIVQHEQSMLPSQSMLSGGGPQ